MSRETQSNPYRDELDAAHRRIAELQRQLGERQDRPPPSEVRELDGHLRSGEKVLWSGWQREVERAEAPAAAGRGVRGLVWLVAGALLAVMALRGLVRPLLFLAPVVACIALIVIAVRRSAGRRRAGGRRLYALTDCRVLALDSGAGRQLLEGAELVDCEHPRLRIGQGGCGDIIVPLRSGSELTLVDVEDVSTVGRLLAEARAVRSERRAEGRDSA